MDGNRHATLRTFVGFHPILLRRGIPRLRGHGEQKAYTGSVRREAEVMQRDLYTASVA